jgi:hypothetical protein
VIRRGLTVHGVFASVHRTIGLLILACERNTSDQAQEGIQGAAATAHYQPLWQLRMHPRGVHGQRSRAAGHPLKTDKRKILLEMGLGGKL